MRHHYVQVDAFGNTHEDLEASAYAIAAGYFPEGAKLRAGPVHAYPSSQGKGMYHAAVRVYWDEQDPLIPPLRYMERLGAAIRKMADS